MKPLLLVELPKELPPLVWWSSDSYIVGASARLDDPEPINFAKALSRYAARHDEVLAFETHQEARVWAERYTGPNWLEIRASLARIESTPPNDLALAAE
ncbi:MULTISPECIES: hypothetical protein [unclassified Aureimonas]|uniref:hypothetical protein n=1 Tax=unclassified Aureimonas TaxID=2615206 RepID=UPI0006F6010B|nr:MULTISPECIES: hypothetical protein [unclassified Aureimonas]KQT63282.1 hypothetical protein ASG62_22385 [Aureimonas sp. Leaf427]KQT80139.1 hypothetical protein ASG54_08380 [Aureimonas sp. Leaf460]